MHDDSPPRDDGTSQRPGDETVDSARGLEASRRTFLSTVGAGVAATATGYGTSGATGTASASTSAGDTPAEEFAENISPDTRATSSGDWNDPGVWDDGPPGDGDDARIEPGVTVALRDGTDRLKTLVVGGELRFGPEHDTHLRTETTVTLADSRLEIGTDERPIAADAEARITFVHHEDLGEKDHDPKRVSKGLLATGDVEIHGREKTAWERLDSPPESGDDTLELVQPPTNWEPGDRVVVPPVDSPDGDELRRVAGVDGRTVTIESALESSHVPEQEDLPVHLANLTRNVKLRSASRELPRRGHVMFMSEEGVSVANAGLHDLGRTDKSEPVTNPRGETDPGTNPKARYALHFHRTGIDRSNEPHVVSGCVAEGSPGWGFVNHHSYAEVTDCVTYDVLGAGFVAEAGDEQGSFVGNMAITSEGSGQHIVARANENTARTFTENPIDDFGHSGHGFWLHSPGIVVEDNVAAGHADYGFVYWGLPLDEAGVDRFGAGHPGVRDMTVQPNYPKEYGTYNRNGFADRVGGESESHIAQGYVTIRSFANNTAYAVGSGVGLRWMKPGQISGQKRHTNYEDYNTIEDFTVYGIHRDGEDPFTGANGIMFSWSTHLWVRDCRLVGNGDGRGVNRGKDFWHVENLAVQDSGIEEFAVGVTASPGPYNVVAGCRLDNRRTNVRSLVGDTHNSSLLWLHGNSYRGAETDLFRHFEEPSTTMWSTFDIHSRKKSRDSGFFESPPDKSNVRVDDWKLYFDYQLPDVKPFQRIYDSDRVPDDETLRNFTDEADPERMAAEFIKMADIYEFDNTPNHPESLNDWEKLVGLTNEQLDEQYDLRASGGMVPAGASRIDFGDHAWATPAAGTDVDRDSDTMPDSLPGMSALDGTTVTVAPDGDRAFSPASQMVEPGTTVTFEWDAAGHTLAVADQPDEGQWDGAPERHDAGYVHFHTFEVPGRYEFYSESHGESMRGTIVVEEATECKSVAEAITGEDGTISDAEILRALRHWREDTEVPGTCGKTIDDL